MTLPLPLKQRDGELINNWYIACLSADLKSKPMAVTIYDEDLVLFRDQDGRPAALANRCIHRHAQLSEGRVCGGQIQCPYHGWVFDPQGRVTSIPSEGGKPPKANYRVRQYPCVEQDECVWVWMGLEVEADAGPPFRFPHFQDHGWRHYFMKTDFNNEVTHLVENFMDVPHTVFVHAGWFRTRSEKVVPISVENDGRSVLVTYHQERDEIGFSSRVLNPSGQALLHTDRFIMPNLTRVDYNFGQRSFVIISQCTPLSTLKTRVYTAIIFRMGVLNFLYEPLLRFYTRQVIDQDVEIMANQGRSFARDMREDFRSTDADVVHLSIEKLRRQGIASRTPPPPTNRVDRELWI